LTSADPRKRKAMRKKSNKVKKEKYKCVYVHDMNIARKNIADKRSE